MAVRQTASETRDERTGRLTRGSRHRRSPPSADADAVAVPAALLAAVQNTKKHRTLTAQVRHAAATMRGGAAAAAAAAGDKIIGATGRRRKLKAEGGTKAAAAARGVWKCKTNAMRLLLS